MNASLIDDLLLTADGKRGLEVALSPADLALLTSAKFADISIN